MSEARPRKPALLLLHGALGAAATLAPLAERLSKQFTVHGLDFHGHGPARADGALTVERLADQVAAYVDSHHLAPARLFGYSLGGYVALHLAATRPELVSRVATLGTKLAWSPEVAAQMARQFDPLTIRAKVPKLADSLEALHVGMGWEALLGATRAMLDDLGARPRLTPAVLATIAHPVRLGVGDRDVTVTIEETVLAMRSLPAGELEVHPATPHALERVDVDRIAASAAKFFRA